jgi:hypothetical protein
MSEDTVGCVGEAKHPDPDGGESKSGGATTARLSGDEPSVAVVVT